MRRLHRSCSRRSRALLRHASLERRGCAVVTLEGLGSPEKLHPLQQAFIAEQAAQCAYCINGMIMQSAALLSKNANPDENQVREALAENLCRCGTHNRIVKAVRRAAATMKQARP